MLRDIRLHQAFDRWLFNSIGKYSTNAWLQGKHAKAYVRWWQGHIDLATIEVNLQWQQKGIFVSFLAHVESKGLPIKIENVLNPYLENHMDRRLDYVKKTDLIGIPTYYKS